MNLETVTRFPTMRLSDVDTLVTDGIIKSLCRLY